MSQYSLKNRPLNNQCIMILEVWDPQKELKYNIHIHKTH